jgi:hypothetical protein
MIAFEFAGVEFPRVGQLDFDIPKVNPMRETRVASGVFSRIERTSALFEIRTAS